MARDTGIEAALSIESAFDGVDAVVIAAATSAHPELIREAIRRGMPAFCEKPLAGNLDIAIAAEIDRSGIPFQLGFQRRFDAGYREAHDRIDGSLGTSTRSGWPATTPPRRTRPTSPSPAGCSGISLCTTSTCSAS